MPLLQDKRDWSLASWLHYLEHKDPRLVRLGTERILSVAKRMKLDKPACPVITVAGTNGKGSTVAALEAIYHTQGYLVGAYTSPHLERFNERVRIAKAWADDELLCMAMYEIDAHCFDDELTYFEMATLAALWCFQKKTVDVIILEVGLGGRLDATNCIDADLAIITTIDFDHQDYLGNSLEEIGSEKAGILRRLKPLIYADTHPPQSVINKAIDNDCPTLVCGQDYQFEDKGDDWCLILAAKQWMHLPKPKITLFAASAAIVASQTLKTKLPIDDASIRDALSDLSVPGRLQRITHNGVDVLFDVAHNVQSARLLALTIQASRQSMKHNKVHAVFSALQDKDIAGMLSVLRSEMNHWYIAELDSPRAAKADYLSSICKDAEISVEFCYNDPQSAFSHALSVAKQGDLIVVFGSFITVGAVMTFYREHLSVLRGEV